MAPKRKRKGQLEPPSEKIDLSNPYDLLTDDESDPSSNQNINKQTRLNAKKVKVPPIVVSISNFHAFRKELIDFIKDAKFSLQINRRGECRIFAETMADHQCLVKYLTNKLYKFFTYDTNTERLFKVVVKGLPSGFTLDEIKNEISDLLELTPVQVIKMKLKSRPGDSRNGISNDFYLVHFKSSELNNLKALEKASLMLHVRVKWEYFNKTRANFQNLTQCRNCQAWGHGTRNCHMGKKCMNCGDSSHDKGSCPVKDDPNKYKCSNCGESHKSNFWECRTRKAILQSRAKHQVRNSRSRPGTNSSACNGQQGNPPLLPMGKNRAAPTVVTRGINELGISNSPFIPAVNKVQQISGTTFATATASNKNFTHEKDNGNFDNFDLGGITPPKMEFLQQSLFGMINDMLKCNSMFEAIQTGVKFANNIVMALKFNNEF